jgi:serine/threonine-protein kinase
VSSRPRLLDHRYRLTEVLGRGGMSIVYRATDEALGREVAIKLLRDEAADDREFVERFRREARAAAALSHPNVVAVYDVGFDGEESYIVMELVEGDDLAALIDARGALDTTSIVRIGGQIADALHHAHGRRIVHRDVKPHNIMLGRGDQAKIGDFGIAVALGAGRMTRTGAMIGSVHYMSPEHLRGEECTPLSDVYSLGIVLFEMCTGRPPFEADSPIAIARLHEQAPVPDPRSLNPRVPDALADTVMQAMQKRPSDRHASAGALAAALRHRQSRSLPSTTQLTRPPERPPTRRLLPRTRPAPPPRRATGYGRAIVLGSLIGAVLAVVAWLYATPPTPAAPSAATPTSPLPTATAAPIANPPTVPLPTAVPTRASTATSTPTPRPVVVSPVPAQSPTPTAIRPTLTPTRPPPPPKPTTVPLFSRVPRVEGLDVTAARKILEEAGFQVVVEEETSPQRKGQVINQNPGPNDTVPTGSRVKITIGT